MEGLSRGGSARWCTKNARTPIVAPRRRLSNSVAAIGSEVVLDVHRGATGTTMQRTYSGAWSDATEIDELVRSSVRLPEGRIVSPVTGGIWLHPADGGEPVLLTSAAASASDIDAVVLDNGNIGIGWLQTRLSDGVYTVTADASGAVVTEEAGVETGPYVVLSDLTLTEAGDGVTATFVTSKRTEARVDEVTFPPGSDPVAPDLADEGPSQDPTTPGGGLPGDDPADEPGDSSFCLCGVQPAPMSPWWSVVFVGVVALRRRRLRRD